MLADDGGCSRVRRFFIIYTAPDIIKMVKVEMGFVEHLGGMENIRKILVGKSDVKESI
jgi:hypothetical protein